MYLYLVRHGQSEGNVLMTFHGQTDYPLTEKGRKQAHQAADKLRADGVTFAHCCASDLVRAWDTAQACLEGRDVAAEVCPDLREQFVGDIEGLTWDEMGERYPDLRHTFIHDWFHTTPPGGESPDDMIARVTSRVDEIIARGEDTLIVAHFGPLSLILSHLGLADRGEIMTPKWAFDHGTYSAIRIENGRAELIHFNR